MNIPRQSDPFENSPSSLPGANSAGAGMDMCGYIVDDTKAGIEERAARIRALQAEHAAIEAKLEDLRALQVAEEQLKETQEHLAKIQEEIKQFQEAADLESRAQLLQEAHENHEQAVEDINVIQSEISALRESLTEQGLSEEDLADVTKTIEDLETKLEETVTALQEAEESMEQMGLYLSFLQENIEGFYKIVETAQNQPAQLKQDFERLTLDQPDYIKKLLAGDLEAQMGEVAENLYEEKEDKTRTAQTETLWDKDDRHALNTPEKPLAQIAAEMEEIKALFTQHPDGLPADVAKEIGNSYGMTEKQLARLAEQEGIEILSENAPPTAAEIAAQIYETHIINMRENQISAAPADDTQDLNAGGASLASTQCLTSGFNECSFGATPTPGLLAEMGLEQNRQSIAFEPTDKEQDNELNPEELAMERSTGAKPTTPGNNLPA